MRHRAFETAKAVQRLLMPRSLMQISFTINGKPLGVAFSDLRTFEPHLAYFPAISVSQGEQCLINLGHVPFKYPVEGFKPIAPPQSAAAVQQCTFLLKRLEVLAGVRRSCADIVVLSIYVGLHTRGQHLRVGSVPGCFQVAHAFSAQACQRALSVAKSIFVCCSQHSCVQVHRFAWQL